MCGIVFAGNFETFEPVNRLIEISYLNQKSRGSEGFGFVELSRPPLTPHDNVSPSFTSNLHLALDEKSIIKKLDVSRSPIILFHHRFPTSTPNTIQTAHPIKIEKNNKTYYFVHNGVISNAYKLRKKHRKSGIQYVTQDKSGIFNDSESLAHEIIAFVNNEITQIRAYGSAAFMLLETENNGTPLNLYMGRNSGNPLNVHAHNGLLLISSEGPGYLLPKDNLYRINLLNGDLDALGSIHIQFSKTFNTPSLPNFSNVSPYNASEIDTFNDEGEAQTIIDISRVDSETLEAELEEAEINGDETYAAMILAELDIRYDRSAGFTSDLPEELRTTNIF